MDDGFSGNAFGSCASRPTSSTSTSSAPPTTSSSRITYERLFERFPNLRVASIENGAEFLPDLFRKLQASPGIDSALANYYKEDPGLLFKEHVWINPFWEDDVYEVEPSTWAPTA